MRIERVSYTKTFPIAAYCTEKIGVDFELQAGEDANYALTEAKKLVEEFHKNNNPQLYENNFANQSEWHNNVNINELTPIVQQPAALNPLVKKTKEEGYIFLIENATSEKELETYKPLAKNYPQIQTAYDKKLKELNK